MRLTPNEFESLMKTMRLPEVSFHHNGDLVDIRDDKGSILLTAYRDADGVVVKDYRTPGPAAVSFAVSEIRAIEASLR